MTELLLAAALGLLIGSFLNVCILRLPHDYSVVTPRSHCYSCGSFLAWYENIPVLSWIALGGRCRHCRAAISPRYPLIELFTALCFFWAVRQAGWTWSGFRLCAFAALMIGLIATDLDCHILPDEFTLGGLPLGLTLAAIEPLHTPLLSLIQPEMNPRLASFLESAAAALLASGGLWLLGFLYRQVRGREGLGLGDVKMIAMIAAFLGFVPSLEVVMLGSVAGSIIGLVWIKLRHGDLASEPLPFGAFLGAAALLISLLG